MTEQERARSKMMLALLDTCSDGGIVVAHPGPWSMTGTGVQPSLISYTAGRYLYRLSKRQAITLADTIRREITNG